MSDIRATQECPSWSLSPSVRMQSGWGELESTHTILLGLSVTEILLNVRIISWPPDLWFDSYPLQPLVWTLDHLGRGWSEKSNQRHPPTTSIPLEKRLKMVTGLLKIKEISSHLVSYFRPAYQYSFVGPLSLSKGCDYAMALNRKQLDPTQDESPIHDYAYRGLETLSLL